jgi:hypothetical protein
MALDTRRPPSALLIVALHKNIGERSHERRRNRIHRTYRHSACCLNCVRIILSQGTDVERQYHRLKHAGTHIMKMLTLVACGVERLAP